MTKRRNACPSLIEALGPLFDAGWERIRTRVGPQFVCLHSPEGRFSLHIHSSVPSERRWLLLEQREGEPRRSFVARKDTGYRGRGWQETMVTDIMAACLRADPPD